jgi:ribosomal protein S3AE
MPNPWSVEDLYGNQVTRFSYDITAHQLRLMTQDLHKHVAQQIADHVESKIQEMLFNGSMEQFVKDAVEKEIRSQVKAAVAARLDDFLEDFLAD